MRSYMRYFYEAFALSGMSEEQILARVRTDMSPQVRADLERGSIVLAMSHMGNWDLAGAWACRRLAPVLTVAERLEPVDLFEQFVSFREGLGMTIIGQGRGERVFDRLVDAAQEGGPYVIPLLATVICPPPVWRWICAVMLRVSPLDPPPWHSGWASPCTPGPFITRFSRVTDAERPGRGGA